MSELRLQTAAVLSGVAHSCCSGLPRSRVWTTRSRALTLVMLGCEPGEVDDEKSSDSDMPGSSTITYIPYIPKRRASGGSWPPPPPYSSIASAKAVTMRFMILGGDHEAVSALLDSTSKQEAIQLLERTYGGVNREGVTNAADGNFLRKGTSPILHAARCGQPAMFSVIFEAMKSRELKTPLSRTDSLGRTVLFLAARSGSTETFEAVLAALRDEPHRGNETHQVRESFVTKDKVGMTIFLAAVNSGNKETFEAVLAGATEEVGDELPILIAAKDEYGNTLLSAAVLSTRVGLLEAVLGCVQEHLSDQQADKAFKARVAKDFSLDAAFKACADRYLAASNPPERYLEVLSFLMASYAQPSQQHLTSLSRQVPGGRFKVCCTLAVASAANPFIPGMALSVALANAAEEAPEGEKGHLADIQKSVDSYLLCTLENLPQTVRGLDWSTVFEPEAGGRAVGYGVSVTAPLSLALQERKHRETFCKAPLIMDFLSRRFTLGLPDLRDTKGVLDNSKELQYLARGMAEKGGSLLIGATENEEVDTTYGASRRARPEFYPLDPIFAPRFRVGETTSGPAATISDCAPLWRHKVLLGRYGLLATLKSPRTLLQGANARFPGLGFLPGAQFLVAGLLAKPNNYYRVPAMRMLLDLVVYLGMLAVFSSVVLLYDDEALTWGECIFAGYIVTAGIKEVREMKMGVDAYSRDHWNVFDVLGLVLLAGGFISRGVDGGSSWGRSLYALSAPLLFFRALFFAQIFPSQGPMIQVIFMMSKELVKFGIVMIVVMVGFAMSFHALFRDIETFGDTFLNLFKAMLGEVGLFDEFSGGRYERTSTILLVVYLVIVAIMLLNLLVAVLSTAHAKVQEDVELELKISKALIIRRYQLVVERNWLPAPFNLIQLVVLLPFACVPCSYLTKPYRRAREAAKEAVGRVVFWLVCGPIAVIGGTLLWVASVLHAPFVWHRHYSEYKAALRSRCEKRQHNLPPQIAWLDAPWSQARFLALRYFVVCIWCIAGAPLCLFGLWVKAPLLAFGSMVKVMWAGMGRLIWGKEATSGPQQQRQPRANPTPSANDELAIEDMLKKVRDTEGIDRWRRCLAAPVGDDGAILGKKEGNSELSEFRNRAIATDERLKNLEEEIADNKRTLNDILGIVKGMEKINQQRQGQPAGGGTMRQGRAN